MQGAGHGGEHQHSDQVGQDGAHSDRDADGAGGQMMDTMVVDLETWIFMYWEILQDAAV